MKIFFHKLVNNLLQTLQKDSVYFVQKGDRVRAYVTNSNGTVVARPIEPAQTSKTYQVQSTGSGSWNVDYSDDNWEEIKAVIPVAVNVGSGLTDNRWATLSSGHTTSQASGFVLRGTALGVLQIAASGVTVNVTVIGIR